MYFGTKTQEFDNNSMDIHWDINTDAYGDNVVSGVKNLGNMITDHHNSVLNTIAKCVHGAGIPVTTERLRSKIFQGCVVDNAFSSQNEFFNLRSGIHKQMAEGVTSDIYFKIPAIESAHLKQEALTCVGDVKTISRCKTYYGWSRTSEEGIKDPIHLSKSTKPIEKKESETIRKYAANLKMVDHIWGGIPENSNETGNFTRRLTSLGGIQPLVVGGLCEANVKLLSIIHHISNFAAHKMYISGNAKSFASARALKRAHFSKTIGMIMVKSKALHKIKALNLCANTKQEAAERYKTAKTSFVWDFTYPQAQDYFEYAGAFGGFPFNDSEHYQRQ